MIKRWLYALFATLSVAAGLIALQSCGGVGGPTTSNGGQGSVSAQFLALLPTAQRSSTYIGSAACGKCHTSGSPDAPFYTNFQSTKHFNQGVTCENCHGPGSAHQANPVATNILTYPSVTNPVVCAQCHGPIAGDYNTSAHAQLVASPVSSAVTNPAGQASGGCVLCHSGLIRTQVFEAGGSLSTIAAATLTGYANDTLNTVPFTASCSTCHDPHKVTGNLNEQGEEVQLRHQIFNTSTTGIVGGSTAAQYTAYNHVCAECHNGRGGGGDDASLKASTSRPDMHHSNQMQMLLGFGGAEDANGPVVRNMAHAQITGQCATCHMPNARHTFTVSFDTSCTPCHTAADAATRAKTVQTSVLNELVALKTRMANWAQAKYGNPLAWDYTSNITSGTVPTQSTIPVQILRARHNYYYIVISGDYGVHNDPYTEYLITYANSNLDAIGVAKSVIPAMSKDSALAVVAADKARAQQADLTTN